MSYEFAVGQKVVCIDDAIHPEWHVPGIRYSSHLSGLRKGEIYTIRGMSADSIDGMAGVLLAEIRRPPAKVYGGNESPYAASRFRPLEPKSAELFRAIAADPSKFTFTPSKRERERVRT